MHSRQFSAMLGNKTTLFLRTNPYIILNSNFNLRNSVKFRCLIHQLVPKFTVSSSLGSVFTSANAIAAAAAAAGSSPAHAAVTSTITQVAVTAVAIASGACLSTKVDFLWPKLDEQPGSLVVDGVDVTGHPIFNDPKAGAKSNCFGKESSQRPVPEDW